MSDLIAEYKTRLLEWKYSLYNYVSFKRLSPKTDKIIVSLTTYPKRIDKVHLTIESLLAQKYRDYRVILWLSQEEINEKDLPKSLQRLRKRGLIIKFVEGNIKSYKKLIYALKEYPTSTIITADDDVMYPHWWLGRLLEEQEKYLNTIICYRGHDLKVDKKGNLVSYNEILKSHGKKGLRTEPTYSLMPTGVSGILYPPQSLNETVFEQETFEKLCPTGDDIWFKACSLLNETKCKRVSNSNQLFSTITGSQEFSLFQVNVLLNQNNMQFGKVFTKFNLIKHIKGGQIL